MHPNLSDSLVPRLLRGLSPTVLVLSGGGYPKKSPTKLIAGLFSWNFSKLAGLAAAPTQPQA